MMSTGPSDFARSGRRNLWRFAIPLIVFAGLVTVFYERLRNDTLGHITSPLLGKPVADFALPGIAKTQAGDMTISGFSSVDLKNGTVGIVNIWASWCAPCRAEHPLLMQLGARDDVRVFGINYRDEPENARHFLKIHGNPFTAIGTDEDGRASVEWGVYGIPETFIVNGRGVISFKWAGPITPAILEHKILPAITAAQEVKTD